MNEYVTILHISGSLRVKASGQWKPVAGCISYNADQRATIHLDLQTAGGVTSECEIHRVVAASPPAQGTCPTAGNPMTRCLYVSTTGTETDILRITGIARPRSRKNGQEGKKEHEFRAIKRLPNNKMIKFEKGDVHLQIRPGVW